MDLLFEVLQKIGIDGALKCLTVGVLMMFLAWLGTLPHRSHK